MTPLQLLIDARALIEDPKHWTKGSFARHANGNPIGPAEANATCWCLQGALRATKASGREWGEANSLLGEYLPKRFHTTHDFNDDPTTSHEDVLALLDRAIAASAP